MDLNPRIYGKSKTWWGQYWRWVYSGGTSRPPWLPLVRMDVNAGEVVKLPKKKMVADLKNL